MNVNQLFNNNDVVALDQVQGGKGKLTIKYKDVEISWESDRL